MSSVRFFPEMNEALKKIKDFLVTIEKYKNYVERQSTDRYQKLSEALWEKRFPPDSSVNTRLDLLSDVTNIYAEISLCLDHIKNKYPVRIYAQPLHDTLKYLKEDVELYRGALGAQKLELELEKLESTEKLKKVEELRSEEELCKKIEKLVEQIEADFSELEKVKDIRIDPIDVVIEEEKSSTTNKI